MKVPSFFFAIMYYFLSAASSPAVETKDADGADAGALAPAAPAAGLPFATIATTHQLFSSASASLEEETQYIIKASVSSAPSIRTPLLRQVKHAELPFQSVPRQRDHPVPVLTTMATTWLQRRLQQQHQAEDQAAWERLFEKRPLLTLFLLFLGAPIAFVIFILVVVVLPFQILVWVCNWCIAVAIAHGGSETDSSAQQDHAVIQKAATHCSNHHDSKSKHNHNKRRSNSSHLEPDDETLSVSPSSSLSSSSSSSTTSSETLEVTIVSGDIRGDIATMVDVEL